MPDPRSELAVVRGWRAEFRLWWLMAKHVEITYDKSQNGGSSMSMCLPCCRILSTRECDGTIIETARGCDFHKKRPEIPIAVKSTITSVRLREMLKPNMLVESYFIEKVDSSASDVVSFLTETDLMDVAWVARIRRNHHKAKRSKKVYVHSEEGCIHSSEPESVVQGLGPRHIYFKRCDGLFFNAFGEKLEIVRPQNDIGGTEQIPYPPAPDPLAERVRDLEDLEWISSMITRPCQDDVLSSPLTSNMEDEIEDSTDNPSPVPGDQVSTGFNDKSDPWAAIDDPASSSQASAPPQEISIDAKPPSGEEGTVAPEIEAIQDEAVEKSTQPELVLPASEKTALPSPSATNAQPSLSTSATFLMPYEVEAARQLRDAPPPPASLPVEMDVDATKLAELAWRRLNPYLVQEEEKEEREDQEAHKRSKRKWYKLWRR